MQLNETVLNLAKEAEAALSARFAEIDRVSFENTQKIADMCNLEFVFNEYHLPSFPVPEGYTNEEYFRKLCEDGFAERYDNCFRERYAHS